MWFADRQQEEGITVARERDRWGAGGRRVIMGEKDMVNRGLDNTSMKRL